jgi:hypothetical protein
MTEEQMVEIEVDISDEDFLYIAKQAHERDITFNDMINIILSEQISREIEKGQDNGTSND